MLQVPSSYAVPASLWTADYGSEDGIPCKMLILSEFLKYAQFDIEGNHSCFAGLHARSLPPASPCLLQLPTPPSRLPSSTCQVDWNSLQPGQKLMIKLSLDTIFGDSIPVWCSLVLDTTRVHRLHTEEEMRVGAGEPDYFKTLQRGRGEEISLLCS